MNKIFIVLFCLTYFISFSQKERLFYFIQNDSLLGIKNEKNEIVIVPERQSVLGASLILGKENKEITKNIILLYPENKKAVAYDRNGNYLFEPYIFDFGFDPFKEGHIRIAKGKKMGLATQNGQIVIQPKYDFISTVNFGIIEYCNDCYWDYKKDEEHPPLVGGTWGYLDIKGREIQLTRKRKHPKDLEVKKGVFIPYQFKYNKKEIEIIAFFDKRKESILKANNLIPLGEQVFFEIAEKPTKFEPYYLIKTYRMYNNFVSGSDDYDDFQNFKVTADLKDFYVTYEELVNYEKYSEYIERKIPVDEWLKMNKK